MAQKVNQLIVPKENTEEPKNEASNKAKTKKIGKADVESSDNKSTSKNRLANSLTSIATFWNHKTTQLLSGGLAMLFSLYMVVAFVSFLFTWQQDQDKLMMPSAQYWSDTSITVANWLGKLGAVLANKFIQELFGIGSFLLVPLIFAWGFKKVFKIELWSPSKAFKNLLFCCLWLSTCMGFVFDKGLFFMGGSVGYHTKTALASLIGGVGTGLFLTVTLASFIIIVFNISTAITKKETSEKEEEEDYPTITEEVSNNAIKKNEFNFEKIDTQPIDSEFIPEEPFLKSNNIDPFATNDLELEITPNTVEKEKKTSNDLELEVEMPKEEPLKEFNVVQQKIEQERLSNTQEDVAAEIFARLGAYDPTADLSDYKYPTIDLLNLALVDKGIDVSKEELQENKDKILKTLLDFGIEIEKIKATIGPTVVLYEIVPKAGIKISKIKNLEDDIALSLSALGIRIIAPMPGKGTIGIEVPNSRPQIVPMSSILNSDKFINTDFDLPMALGKTISNETFVVDLAKMPHLLMAGATGQGKSVGLNAILTSLLYKKHPSQLKFVLIDPKKVELTLFNKIERHFLAKLPDTDEAIITDTKKVVHTLNSLCIEMDSRYELLKNAQVRNIKEYNKKFIERRLSPKEGHMYLPYIVVVIDEFADLIITAGKEIETPIARIAQLARAVGIHLIIATQRPSVNVITGTIKANFPGRIAFRVASKIDSRTILDAGGADQLIGRGDMLLTTGNDLTRIQCAFVDTPEVDNICDFIGSQRAYPSAFILPEYIDENGEGSKKEDVDLSALDSMFEEAAKLIVQHQQGSTSLIQRRLKLGYNRAGRIIDQLEAAGIVGAFEGSKARQVLIKDETSLELLLKDLK